MFAIVTDAGRHACRWLCTLVLCLFVSVPGHAFTPPKEIIVVTDVSYPPYLFSTDDELHGIIRDKWEIWSSRTGVRAHVVGMTWAKAQQAVQQGTADVIETLTYSEARTALYEFSLPYAPVQAHVYFHRSISGISDVPSMRGFTIGAKESSACASWLAERGVDTLRFYATSESLVQAAGNGDVRLFCMDSMTAQYYLFKLELADEFLVSLPLYSNHFHWAVKKGNTELRDFIQNGFDRFTAQELEDIDAAWIGNPLRFPIATRYLYYLALVGILVVIVSAALIVWNRSLRARVAARTGELRNALMSLEQAISGGNVGLFDWEVQTERVHYSREWKRQIGYTDNEIADEYREWRDRVHPDDLERVLADVKRNLDNPAPDYRTEFRFRHKDGSYRWILAQASVQRDADGKPVRMLGSHVDITARKQHEAMLQGQNQVLEMIAGGARLEQTLDALLYSVEAQSPDMLGSILLLDADGLHVRHGAAPSLPSTFIRAIDGEPIGERAGSCGTAMYRRATVIVEDIATDPLWTGYRQVALEHGLRACWSVPIFDTQRRVLGSFALYFRVPRGPSEWHMRLIETASHTAAIAIGKERGREILRESEAKFRSLAEESLAGVVVVQDRRFAYVNRALAEMLGYSKEEILAFPSVLDLVVKEDHALVLENLRRRLEGEVQTVRFSIRARKKDGSLADLDMYGSRVTVDGRPAVMSTVLDITERNKAHEALLEYQRTLSTLMSNLPGMAYRCRNDKDWTAEFVSEGCHELTGFAAADLIGNRKVTYGKDLIHPDDRAKVWSEVQASLQDRQPYQLTYRITTADKKEKWVWEQGRGIFAADDALLALEGFVLDITERKLAEERVGRLNRVYAMLSGINSVIVRVHDWRELFEETCRIAVVAGKFRLVWAAVLEQDPLRLVPVASESAGEYLEHSETTPHHEPEYLARTATLLQQDAAEKKGLSWRAIMSKQAVYSNDIEHDDQVVLSRELVLARGIRSVAVLPLIVAGEAVGALALHSTEVGIFDDAEMDLLRELAGDIAFGLDNIRKEERITYLAYYDSLTGLANRSLCHERLTQFIHADERDRRGLALCVVDLDHFKDVNDALGRQTGDALLTQFARRLLDCVDNGDQVARLGADRFALVLPSVDSEHEVVAAIQAKISQCVGQPFRLGEIDLRIAAKAGIALYPAHGADADALFRNAEAALKKAKSGGEPYLVYTQKMTERVGEKLALESKLRHARERDEFVLHYQPKVDAQRRRVTGVEALIRWLDPETGTVMPSKFIPLLEGTGLILDVGNWAIRHAIQDRARWAAAGVAPPRVAVNVSSVQLRQRNFVNIVREAVALAQPAGIDLEITESVIMTDIEGNIAKLREIHELGVNIAIDDFGTGYSSLAYLARLPVQVLKIDVHFIARITADPAALTLVTTMVSLAHSLGLTVVAEGVETEKQAILLRQIRCDELQGYLISPSMPPERVVDFLKANLN